MKILIAHNIRVIANLVDHAKDELQLAGLFDKDSDYDGMLGKAVLELAKCFSNQGHSGFSANMTLDIFDKLMKYKPLSPITDNPKEWQKVTDNDDNKPLWQNNRNPSLFSNNNGKTYYDVDDKKRFKTRSKKFKKKASGKPSIFQRTIYRLPNEEELKEVDFCNLSPDKIIEGFMYTIVGRGVLRQKQKDFIITSIEKLNTMFPGKYNAALNQAKKIKFKN